MTKTELKNEWLKRLESGNYKQGKKALYKKEDGKRAEYCCLGVLCKVFEDNGLKVDKNWRRDMTLPYEIMKKMEMTECGDLKSGEDTLAVLNDTGKKFKEIAKIIRAGKVKGLGK